MSWPTLDRIPTIVQLGLQLLQVVWMLGPQPMRPRGPLIYGGKKQKTSQQQLLTGTLHSLGSYLLPVQQNNNKVHNQNAILLVLILRSLQQIQLRARRHARLKIISFTIIQVLQTVVLYLMQTLAQQQLTVVGTHLRMTEPCVNLGLIVTLSQLVLGQLMQILLVLRSLMQRPWETHKQLLKPHRTHIPLWGLLL